MIGGLLAALAETVDPVIRSGEDVERHLDIPVLATVSRSLGDPPAGGERPSGGQERRSGRLSARAATREGRSRWAAAAVWLLIFVVAVAVVAIVFYPGWGRLKGMFAGGASTGRTRPAGVEALVAAATEPAGSPAVAGRQALLNPSGDRASGQAREPSFQERRARETRHVSAG